MFKMFKIVSLGLFSSQPGYPVGQMFVSSWGALCTHIPP